MASQGTPWAKDKRFVLTAGTIAAVLAMHWVDKAPGEQILTFVGLLVAGYMGQSQYGQTKRAIAAPDPSGNQVNPKGPSKT